MSTTSQFASSKPMTASTAAIHDFVSWVTGQVHARLEARRLRRDRMIVSRLSDHLKKDIGYVADDAWGSPSTMS